MSERHSNENVELKDLARISPLAHAHVIPNGTYHFSHEPPPATHNIAHLPRKCQVTKRIRRPQFFSVLVFRFLLNYNAVSVTLDWQAPSPESTTKDGQSSGYTSWYRHHGVRYCLGRGKNTAARCRGVL